MHHKLCAALMAFAVLGIGPVVGTLAMIRLRSLPESLALANGRQ